MPVWNAGPFLAPAVASLLAQTETDFELLAVDDGSTDGSRETLHQLAAADRRVRLIEHGQGNEGIATARNRLLEAARKSGSPFVAFLNHDDLARPERLRRQMTYLEEHPRVGWLGSNHALIDADGRDLGNRSDWPRRDLEIRWLGLLDCPTRFSTVTVRASLLAAMASPWFDPAYAVYSDYDFVSRALAAARANRFEVRALPEVLGAFRRHPGAASVRKAALMVTNGTRIAAAAIARELPGHGRSPEDVANVRAVLFGARPPGWRATLQGHRQALETYLDLFDAFRDKHRDHPDLAHLQTVSPAPTLHLP